MAYKYTPAGAQLSKTPREYFTDDFQQNLEDGFYETFTWHTIEEEDVFASGELNEVDVRINRVINQVTGEKMGDDWKQILFKEITHSTGIGYLYYFDLNYWIVVNSEIIRNLAASSTVRRCNNTLRWMDTAGATYSAPCAIDVPIKQNIDYTAVASALVTPKGTIQVVCQYNSATNMIKPNQRFLFGNVGNWTAWKVSGGGVQNYNNLQTENNTSAGVIVFTMERNYDNIDTDDLTNGIARVDGDVYTLSLNHSSLSLGVSQTSQLFATVKLNGEVVTRNVIWESDTTAKASISSTGLVTGLVAGTCTLTCSLSGNDSIYATCAVTVGASPSDVYDIRVSPVANYVLEGLTQIFTVYLYKNDTIQSDTFTITLITTSIPSTYFTFSATTNGFTIRNIMKYLSAPLVVRCVSGTNTKDVSITLKGKW